MRGHWPSTTKSRENRYIDPLVASGSSKHDTILLTKGHNESSNRLAYLESNTMGSIISKTNSSSETQPLLLHHDSKDMRALIPLPVLVTLILFPILLLPYIFNRPVTDVRNSQEQRLRAAGRNDSVRLLSMNMFIRPRLVGWSDYKDERLEDLLGVLRQRDLLCLQELFWTTGKRKQRFLDRLANDLPYSAHAPKPGIGSWLQFPPKPIDAGLAIVSARRIVDAKFHMFSTSAWNTVDWFVSKGVLYARVEVLSGVVHVFTTHMQAGYYPNIRRQQVSELVKFVRQVVRDDDPIIIAGDFNINGRRGYDDDGESQEYKGMMKMMLKLGVVDVVKEFLGQVVTTAGGLSGDTQRNERIDYLFLKSGGGLVASVSDGGVRIDELRVSGREYRTMSDHYAIMAEIMVQLG